MAGENSMISDIGYACIVICALVGLGFITLCVWIGGNDLYTMWLEWRRTTRERRLYSGNNF
jgi:hypothetical protein